MAIVAADLKAYCAVNDAANPPGPIVDTAVTVGGAIDTEYKAALSATGAQIDTGGGVGVEFVTGSGPAGSVVVVARHATGVSEASDSMTLAAGPVQVTWPVGSNTDITNILSITLNAALSAGDTVDVRITGAGALIHQLVATERGWVRFFREAASQVAQTIRYEKLFLKNDEGTGLALLNAVVSQSADLSGRHRFALETTVNGSGSIADRLAPGSPPSITAFGTAPITLLDATGVADLLDTAAIGVWIEQTLDASESPITDVQDRVEHTLAGDTAP